MKTTRDDFEPNLQILANAGSGKTHTLVTRIIRILAREVEPRKVIALTFTRKAAGEFLSKLLQRLADASLDPAKAAELSASIRGSRDCGGYQKLLRIVVGELGRLQLTTFDSFFNRVVSSFPQELGLAGVPTLLDPHAEELAGKNSLRRALTHLDKSEQDLLVQALLERDEGAAPLSAGRDLHNFRREVHGAFIDHPEADAWGSPRRIWGAVENPWKALTEAELKSHRETVERETGSPEFPSRTRKAWNLIAHLARGVKLNTIVEQILKDPEEWWSGEGKFTHYNKAFTPSTAARQAAMELVEHFVNECTDYRLREARVVHHLLAFYEREYEAEVRSRGRLTYSDVTNLLLPGERFLGMGRGPLTETQMLRLHLDERLDTLFDHWLLDEFQDTSRNQYRVLENILDEVISEGARSGGQRSFFCVGDIKQAIYGWRKGEARLFDEIHERYRGKGGLARSTLSSSWRSAPEILKSLNAIFGDLPATAPGLPERTRQRWQNSWNGHQPARQTGHPGYVSWVTVAGGNDQEKKEDLQNRVVSSLFEATPGLERGMTIALLVRTTKEANEWLEVLRSAGISALSESNPPVGHDSPVAAVLRSVLSLTAHPGDAFALGHLAMEPLKPFFFPGGDPKRELGTLISESASHLVEGGFAGVSEWLFKRIAPLIGDAFSRNRAASLRRAALKADAAGITGIDDFLLFLADYAEPGRSAPCAVQVMTVHKAKGLEYDMVLLPLPGRQEALDSLSNDRIDLWENERGEAFLMKLPGEELRNLPGNETLAHAAEGKREENAFEELCVWYVAMSRARQALLLFSNEAKPSEKGKCPNFPQLLSAGFQRLEGFASGTLGNPKWHEGFVASPQEADQEPLPRNITLPPRPPALEKFLPSGEGEGSLFGIQAFPERNAAALGTAIHGLFEKIEWLDQPWQAPAGLSEESAELMAKCLGNASVKQLFIKPPHAIQLWREKRFDLLLDRRWISGCFDRVVIRRDAMGNATGADLIDFKTDQSSREELIIKHTPQLESYRAALSSLLKIPESTIRMILLHLRAEDPVVELG